jgi:pyoverdine/dityrosine biosynthesis protein Dit1
MFSFLHRRRKQQKLMAEFVRELRDGIRERAELNRKYSEVIHKNIELLEQSTQLLNENTKLKCVMAAAPALTEAAEKSIEHVQKLEAAWTQSGNECVQ